MKIGTSIEQSKTLIELGIDVNTADMMWDDWSLIDEGWKLSVGYYPEIEKDYGRKCYPAWSLAALLNILPHCIDDRYDLVLGKLSDNKGWYVMYDDIDHFTIFHVTYSDLIDACIDMIVKLKEKDLI